MQPYFRDKIALDGGFEMFLSNNDARQQVIRKLQRIASTAMLHRKLLEECVTAIRDDCLLVDLAAVTKKLVEQPSMHTSSSDLSPPEKTVVSLADGKNRTIMYTSETKFYMDGKVVAPKQFIEILFGELPELFKDEEDLREQWSDPRTREILLQGLAERGFEETKLQALKTLCDAENSDIYDVLRYTAYARDTMTRTERAGLLREYYLEQLDEDERRFVGYVLAIYESRGEQELRMDNLTGLVRLRYRTLRDATYHLGSPAEIVSDFLEFQRELYQAVDVT